MPLRIADEDCSGFSLERKERAGTCVQTRRQRRDRTLVRADSKVDGEADEDFVEELVRKATEAVLAVVATTPAAGGHNLLACCTRRQLIGLQVRVRSRRWRSIREGQEDLRNTLLSVDWGTTDQIYILRCRQKFGSTINNIVR